MKNELSRLMQRGLKRRTSDTNELAARLAPLEEQAPVDDNVAGVRAPAGGSGLVTQEYGAIVVGNHQPRVSQDVIEGRARKGFLEPVVIAIVGLMLGFIGFIAWLISRMPVE